MSSLSYAEPSVDALRAEAEATRRRLTGTVDDLRTQVADTATDIKERLSPDAIKTEVTQYVRDSRDQLWHSWSEKARDNPLQAVAVGAALAYPALKIMRAMPAPLLLVGAGTAARAHDRQRRRRTAPCACAAGRDRHRQPDIRQRDRSRAAQACMMHRI